MRWLEYLASRHLTIAAFVLLAAGALASTYGWVNPTPAMALPFAILGFNVAAAIAIHRRFRADFPLLVFHLALLALVLLFVLGRLIYLDAAIFLNRGDVFEGRFQRIEAGPLHGNAYRELRFRNDDFVEGDPQGRYRDTRNTIAWLDPDSHGWVETVIGNDRPLRMRGYRLYPTHHRGFSLRFSWIRPDLTVEFGSVQLPPIYQALRDFPEGVAWTLADGTEVWVQLNTHYPPQQIELMRNLGSPDIEHELVVRIGEARQVMRPGDSFRFSGGSIRYEGLNAWLGYRLIYDPTEIWLAAVIIIGLLSIAAYYLRMLRRRVD